MNDQSISELLRSLPEGDPEAADKLYRLVYTQLRRIAGRQLKRERQNHTLSTTDLVHEAYIKLVGQEQLGWQNRAHFMGVAAQAMRRILIDHARKKNAAKRGGIAMTVPFDDAVEIGSEPGGHDLLALDRALTRLQERQPDKARVVELRYFGGMSEKEIAEVLGISTRTVSRHWKFSQAWLSRDLRRGDRV